MRRIALAGALFCGAPVAGQAARPPYVVRLNARFCTAAADRAAGLGPAWQVVAVHVRACAVRGPDGRPSLTVVIVRVDGIYADPALHRGDNLDIPNPILLGPMGERLGELPEGFPIDPPGALRVTFTQWRRGFPWRIDLYEGGVSALQPHPLDPMLWNPQTHQFNERR